MNKYVALFIFFSGALWACTSSDTGNGGPENGNTTMPLVEAVKAKYGSLPLEERLSGSVRAQNQIEIFSEVTGPVAEVFVRNGDFVEKGDLLLSLRDEEFKQRLRQSRSSVQIAEARVKQARATIAQVEAQLKRTRVLAERNLGSDLELETQTAQVESAKANLELVEAQLDQARSSLQEQMVLQNRFEIRAPVNGHIGGRMVEAGQRVDPTTRLFVLGDLSKVRIRVMLTERMLDYIEPGQEVIIRASTLPDSTLRTSVSRISPFLDPITHTTTAEIDVSGLGGRLYPGQFVQADILYGQTEMTTLVPNAALYEDPRTGIEGVFVAKSLSSEIEIAKHFDPNSPPPATEATPITWVPIEITARGRVSSGITGVRSGDFVVTVGQNLLGGASPQARVRAIDWERILVLQSIKQSDVLDSLILANRQDNS